MSALENVVCVLNREVEHNSVTLEAYSHQHRLDQDKMENLGNKVRQLERMLTMRDLQLAETEQLLREMQFCTFDGVFVWKISEFLRRRQDALAGRTPAMFSPGTTPCSERRYRHYVGGDRTSLGKSWPLGAVAVGHLFHYFTAIKMHTFQTVLFK